MNRESIDGAALAQFNRMMQALRCVERSGGTDRWSHMFSHGVKFPTIRSLVSRGYLTADGYQYELTEAGRQCLADVDEAKLRAS